MLMSFKYSNCLKVIFDHLRFSFNASNAVLMCIISVKYQYTIQAVCAYAYSTFFRKYRGVRILKIPGCAHIGACALIRTNTVFTEKNLFIFSIHGHFPIHKASHENENKKKKVKTQIILVTHCSLRSN